MREIDLRARRKVRIRRGLGFGTVVVGLVVSGGVAATAGDPSVSRQPNGVVRIDNSGLTYVYDGRKISEAAVGALQAEGKAQVTVSSPEAACRGRILVFDTRKEADADFAAYRARVTQQPPPDSTEPVCTRYLSSPGESARQGP